MEKTKKILRRAEITTTVEWILYTLFIVAAIGGKGSTDPVVIAIYTATFAILVALLRIRILLRAIRADALRREIAQSEQP